MNAQTVVAGVGMVPFKRPGQSDPYDVMAEAAVRAALADARLDYDLIDQAFAGFAYADSCSGQRALHRIGITGIPIANVNNTGASGSTALHLARQAVLSGEAECVLTVGFEEMQPGAPERSFPATADPNERQRERAMAEMGFDKDERALPLALQLFAAQLEWMHREMGIADATFAQVAVKARAHAAINPYAMSRDPLTVEAVLAQSPLIGRLRKPYACSPSSGAAAVVLCTQRFAARHGLKQDVTILAQVMVSDTASDLEQTNVLDALGRGATQRASRRAYAIAGLGPEDVAPRRGGLAPIRAIDCGSRPPSRVGPRTPVAPKLSIDRQCRTSRPGRTRKEESTMMNYEKFTTSYIDAESYPWIPFLPYSDAVFIKALKADPISGTFVTLLKAPGTIELPKHHHCGIVIVYTIKGSWKYKEHDWTAAEGSVVYETAASTHTPIGATDGEVITLNIQVGDSIYMDDAGKVLAIENWKTMLERYLGYCKGKGITPVDITSFAE